MRHGGLENRRGWPFAGGVQSPRSTRDEEEASRDDDETVEWREDRGLSGAKSRKASQRVVIVQRKLGTREGHDQAEVLGALGGCRVGLDQTATRRGGRG